jgi:hypothetical protein
LRIGEELLDLGESVSDECFYGLGGAIAEPNPEDLRRVSFEETSLAEVGVFSDNRETVLGGVRPNRGVSCLAESDIPYMDRAGETICESPAQQGREILIEK